jgi:acetoin:2,6-dichlorophenolindophenol oxidoreductase subunit alpha
MTAATSKNSRAKTKPAAKWENPLIPNKKLRALYTAMVELRLLEEFVARLQKTKKNKPPARLSTAPGEEGCFVSTLIDLEPGDLTSAGHRSVATEFMRGAKLPPLVRHITALVTNPAKDSELASPSNERNDLHLPFLEDGLQRLNLAAGAALALKAANLGKLVVAYARPKDLNMPEWQQVLQFAGAQSLPLILVTLPEVGGPTAAIGRLSRLATDNGVPGILVDAADPVALYRVAQESTQRARANGGAVLMECIPFPLAEKLKQPTDPIETMKRFLLSRQVVTEAWMNQVSYKFRHRLENASR